APFPRSVIPFVLILPYKGRPTNLQLRRRKSARRKRTVDKSRVRWESIFHLSFEICHWSQISNDKWKSNSFLLSLQPPSINRRRICQRGRSLNVRAGASFPPGEKTSQRERDSGPNQKRAAERGQSGDSLSYKAGHLSGVSESQERAQSTSRGVTGKRLPSRDLAGLSIQRQLRALVRLAAVALVNREGQRRARRAGYS